MGGRGVLVGGHRSLGTYEQVLAKVASNLERHQPRPVEALLAEYGPLTTPELSAILGKDPAQDLRERAMQGSIVAVELRGGTLWALPGNATVGLAAHPSRSVIDARIAPAQVRFVGGG